MKKIVFLSLLLLSLVALLCISGHAEELALPPAADTAGTEGSSPDTTEEAITDTDVSEDTADAGEEVPPDTVAGTVAAFIAENADTFLGLLTLVGSLIVAFLYKTGLLPMLRAGLSALADTLGKSREATERFTADAGEHIRRIEEETKPVLAAVERSEALIRTLEERLCAMETAIAAGERDRHDTAAILRTETELFYELLHSVNLPEAQKEAMSESFYRLKRALEAGV